jgi:hypothetical protein
MARLIHLQKQKQNYQKMLQIQNFGYGMSILVLLDVRMISMFWIDHPWLLTC